MQLLSKKQSSNVKEETNNFTLIKCYWNGGMYL